MALNDPAEKESEKGHFQVAPEGSLEIAYCPQQLI
jgi:hypothetical protein